MSKPKHKLVVKYAVDDQSFWHGNQYEKRMTVVRCEFIQSDKRLTLVKSESKAYRDAARAIGFRSYVPVGSGAVHDSPMGALNAAVDEAERQVKLDEARLRQSKDNLERVKTLYAGWEIDLELSS